MMTTQKELELFEQIVPTKKKVRDLEVGDCVVHQDVLDGPAHRGIVYVVERVEHDDDGDASVFMKPKLLHPESKQCGFRADSEVATLGPA